jgi:tetratricopeptide (TPR) repeat protein
MVGHEVFSIRANFLFGIVFQVMRIRRRCKGITGIHAKIEVVAPNREFVSIRNMCFNSSHGRKIAVLLCNFTMCLLFGVPSAIAAEQDKAAARAVPATERALAEAERKLGFLNAKSLSYRRWLTGLYQIQGRHVEAATLMRREMEAFEELEGPHSTNLASSMNQLADIYRKGGRAREANELLLRALSIYQKQPARGKNPALLAMLTQRPDLVPIVEKIPLPAFRRTPARVLSVNRAVTRAVPVTKGETAPTWAKRKPTLRDLQSQGPDPVPVVKKKPVPAFRRAPALGLPVNRVVARVVPVAKRETAPAQAKREPTLRELQYLERAMRLDQEAGELWWQNRIVDVERNYREAVRYREAALGRNHPDVGQSLIRLARLYWSTNRNSEAYSLHRWAIAILAQKLPTDSTDLADAMWEFGGFLQIIGDYNSAQPLMLMALTVFEKDADKRTNMSHRRATYATVLKEMGRGEEAASLRR